MPAGTFAAPKPTPWKTAGIIALVVAGIAIRIFLWVQQGVITFWVDTGSNVQASLFDPPMVEVGAGAPRGEVLREPGVYLAPFADFPQETLMELRTYLRETWDIDAKLLGPITIEDSAKPQGNEQLDAFNLADQVLRAYTITVSRTAVIGFVRYDVRAYATGDFWNFGAVNPTGYAVISTARMDPLSFGEPRDNSLLMERLRKMTVRYVAVVYYQLPYSDDPRSVLYRPIRSAYDLDAMTEWPCPERARERVAC